MARGAADAHVRSVILPASNHRLQASVAGASTQTRDDTWIRPFLFPMSAGNSAVACKALPICSGISKKVEQQYKRQAMREQSFPLSLF